MSKPILTGLVIAIVAMASAPVEPTSAGAAELVAPPAVRARHHGATLWCGPCGCLHVSYTYHRELRSTYSLNFDPRNFDQTQPYYFLGPVRAYPRYWCDAASWR
jgi:hypothetical protein